MKIETRMRLRKLIAGLPKPWPLRACYRSLNRLYRKPRTPQRKIESLLLLCEVIQAYGGFAGKACLEVGPGARINLPIIMWLMGAERVLSVDLAVRIDPSYMASDIEYYRANRQRLVTRLLRAGGEGAEISARLERLLALNTASREELVEQILALSNITYLAPADAGQLGDIAAGSFDMHLSHNVLEHAPPENMRLILRTAVRLLKPDGICVHQIDHTDHSDPVDRTIAKVNFLRYDDEQWSRYTDGWAPYVNRLRASEYLPIFEDCGLDVLEIQNTIDDGCVNLIKTGALPLAEKFRSMATTDLATTGSIIVAVPRR